jgi:hypothetical protein
MRMQRPASFRVGQFVVSCSRAQPTSTRRRTAPPVPCRCRLERRLQSRSNRPWGTILPFGRCAVHAAEIDWSTGEFEWVQYSHVLVATLPRSPIPTKAKKTALCARAAVRFSQPAASSGGLLNAGKSIPKFEPPDAKASTVFGAPLQFTIGQDKRSATGACHRFVVVQRPWIYESGASTNWASDFIRVVGPLVPEVAIVIRQWHGVRVLGELI